MAVWRGVLLGGEFGPAFNTSVQEDEAQRLAVLAEGARVLEVGSAYGYSAAVMALGGAVSVAAVDPHTSVRSAMIMEANLKALMVWHLVTMIPEYSETALPRMIAAGSKFDLIFVDGNHLGEAALADAEASQQLLNPGGTLLFHDYGDPDCPDVKPVLDFLYPGGPDCLTSTLWEKQL